MVYSVECLVLTVKRGGLIKIFKSWLQKTVTHLIFYIFIIRVSPGLPGEVHVVNRINVH